MTACGKIKEFISSFFVYETSGIVRLDDWRLAILYYVLILISIGYSLFYGLFWDYGYLVSEVPVGQIRVNALKPDVWKELKDMGYCLLPNETPGTLYNGFPKQKCLYWDEEITVWPQALDGTITLTTRISQTFRELNNCSLDDPTCSWKDSETNVSFLTDPESYTLLLDHSYVATSLGFDDNALNLVGQLLSANGTVMKVEEPECFGQKNKQDILRVSTILRAAGIDLDGPSVYNANHSARYDGCIIFAHVQYTNLFGHYLRASVQYTMRFELMNDTEYKGVQSIYTKRVDDMLRNDRHGIHIVFLQAGSLASFDLRTTLLTIMACIGINAAIILILDIIASHLMPSRAVNDLLMHRETGNIMHMSKDDLSSLVEKLKKHDDELYSLHSFASDGEQEENPDKITPESGETPEQ